MTSTPPLQPVANRRLDRSCGMCNCACPCVCGCPSCGCDPTDQYEATGDALMHAMDADYQEFPHDE